MKRILLVEDDAIIALDLAQSMAEAGYDVLGPAARVAEALDLLRDSGCDAAVLDINLGEETSEAVAIELERRSIPFVTLSGYDADQQLPGFARSESLVKPVRLETLKIALEECMRSSRKSA